MNEKKMLLFLVDDDASYLKSMEIKFAETAESDIKTFSTGEQCLAELSQDPDVIILDYCLDSFDQNTISGLETLKRIKTTNPLIPVIMLSSGDNPEVAVNCLEHKAFDCIVKSETAFIRLQKAITSIFHYQEIENLLSWYMKKS